MHNPDFEMMDRKFIKTNGSLEFVSDKIDKEGIYIAFALKDGSKETIRFVYGNADGITEDTTYSALKILNESEQLLAHYLIFEAGQNGLVTVADKTYEKNTPKKYRGVGIITAGFSMLAKYFEENGFKVIYGGTETANVQSINARKNALDPFSNESLDTTTENPTPNRTRFITRLQARN